jgi:oligopeptide transport system substrate-binding protein
MKKLVFALVALMVVFAVIGAQCPTPAEPTTAPVPTTKPGEPTTVPPTAKPTDVPPPAEPTFINLNHGTEPPTIDPGLATDTTSVQCDQLFFLGLTDFDDKTMETIPELAEKWEVSSDGLKWTFHMRNDINWVQYFPADGKFEVKRPVTAKDVEYGVKRALDPATASEYAYVLYVIKGGQEYNTQTVTDPVSADTVGVKAIDDYTIEFEVVAPAGYFPGIAGMWTARPVPQEPIAEFGDKWTEPGNIWVNGSYVLQSWEHDNKMVMVKNMEHPDAANVQIDQINWFMIVEASTAMAMYENGELDVTGPPLEDMDRVKQDPVLSKELYIAPTLCTYYYGFNNSKAPVDNKNVRRALSYAVDRQTLIDAVLKGGQKPAKTFACPGIFGTPAEDPTFKAIEFDPDMAKKELELAGYPGGQGLPKLTLMYNTSEGHKKIAEFIQSNWKEYLGIDVEVSNQEWAVYLKTVYEDAPQIYRMGWCADYPDENNWVLEVFNSVKSNNSIKWNNPEFDQLTEQAAFETDPAKRKELYFKAEQILCVDEAAIIPIYYYTRVVLTKSYVTRTYAPLGGEHINMWKINRP